MSNALILPSNQLSTFDALAKGSDYLQRLALFQGGSTLCKEGKIKPGNYGIPLANEEVQDLGDNIDILVLAFRPKALDVSDRDSIILSFEEDSEIFKDIQERAPKKGSGCMYGLTFLVFERNTTFFEFFASSYSARIEARKFRPFLPRTAAEVERDVAYVEANEMDVQVPGTSPAKAVTMSSYLKKNVQNPYHVPVVRACSTPITLPPSEVVEKNLKLFFAMKSTEVELADSQDGPVR